MILRALSKVASTCDMDLTVGVADVGTRNLLRLNSHWVTKGTRHVQQGTCEPHSGQTNLQREVDGLPWLHGLRNRLSVIFKSLAWNRNLVGIGDGRFPRYQSNQAFHISIGMSLPAQVIDIARSSL